MSCKGQMTSVTGHEGKTIVLSVVQAASRFFAHEPKLPRAQGPVIDDRDTPSSVYHVVNVLRRHHLDILGDSGRKAER